MSRSTEILYRARRSLKKLTGVDLNDPEYFDSMQQGQIDLLTEYEVMRDKANITTVDGQESYSLLISSREVVGKILAIQKPTTWYLPIEYLLPDRYAEEKEKTQTASQPVWCTVLNNNLLLNPAPSSDGLIMEVWYLLINSATNISATTNPQISFIYDKALEYFTVYDLLAIDNPSKGPMYELYTQEAERKSNKAWDQFSQVQHIEGNW